MHIKFHHGENNKWKREKGNKSEIVSPNFTTRHLTQLQTNKWTDKQLRIRHVCHKKTQIQQDAASNAWLECGCVCVGVFVSVC